MSSVVHFKFRSALLTDTVNFDGDHVSLGDLKRLIAKRKGLLKAIDIDFAITNADTQEGLCMWACRFTPWKEYRFLKKLVRLFCLWLCALLSPAGGYLPFLTDLRPFLENKVEAANLAPIHA